MEENKFEKQVQQKMDELKIHPSDAVWLNIAKRIEKKRRSRWGVLFFFLLAGLMITGGYFIFFNNGKQGPVSRVNSPKLYTTQVPAGLQSNGQDIDSMETDDKESSAAIKHFQQGNSKQHKIQSVKSDHVTQSLAPPSNGKPTSPKSDFASSTKQKLADGNTAFVPKKSEEAIETKAAKTDVVFEENNEEKNATKDSIDENNDVKPTPEVVLNKNATKATDTSAKRIAIMNTEKRKTRNKWKPGILFVAGVSNIGSSVFNINNSNVADYLTYPGTSNSGGGNTFSYPINLSNGVGFTIGVFGKKNIANKVNFSIGDNFTSFSARYKVGNVNVSTGYYSSQNAVNSYKAHYYLIDLPAGLEVQIGKGKNVPFSWEVKIVLSQLISTNALQFNSSPGYYYKDNSIFNKTFLGFNTGLLATFFSKSRTPVSAGPYLYYSTSRIANEGFYDKKHFVFAGLQAKILLKK